MSNFVKYLDHKDSTSSEIFTVCPIPLLVITLDILHGPEK